LDNIHQEAAEIPGRWSLAVIIRLARAGNRTVHILDRPGIQGGTVGLEFGEIYDYVGLHHRTGHLQLRKEATRNRNALAPGGVKINGGDAEFFADFGHTGNTERALGRIVSPHQSS
jgi:hypothetical protein